MKIVALIPARAGSKRIPNKNFKKLGGKPLVDYPVITASECGTISKAYVSSNHKIHNVFGGAGYINRPDELSQDDSTDYDVVKHFSEQVDFDMLVYLRPTTPFRENVIVMSAIHLMYMFDTLNLLTSWTGLRSVNQMTESADKCFTIDDGLALAPYVGMMEKTNLPDQQCTKTYVGNGYVDIILKETIDKGVLFGDKVFAFETEPVIELDTPEQWDYAEYVIKNNIGN